MLTVLDLRLNCKKVATRNQKHFHFHVHHLARLMSALNRVHCNGFVVCEVTLLINILQKKRKWQKQAKPYHSRRMIKIALW